VTISRKDKERIIESTKGLIDGSLSVVSCHYVGVKAEDMARLRVMARDNGVVLSVVGNRLAKIAFKGTRFEAVSESFKESTLLAFSYEAPGAAARLLKTFMKEQEALKVKAISLGDGVMGPDKIGFVASMPTRDEALALIARVVNAPVRDLALSIKDIHGQLVRTVSAIAEQKQAAA